MIARHLIDDSNDPNGDSMEVKTASPCHHSDDNASLSYDRYRQMFHCGYRCTPGLILSDSEDSSFASCGTEEFFDLEEISSTLNLIENWQKLHRRVRFGSAHVQEYAITVGDHPICKDGLALSLDWAHAEEKVYDIDYYESRRQSETLRRGMKRRRRVSKLDYWQRREILYRIGCFTYADLSRIECKRNREAVSEFLQDVDAEDYGPSMDEQEEQGIELEQIYDIHTDDPSSSLLIDAGSGWQMNIQILEG